jgi:glucose/arabinose dehydrogenase
MTMRTILFRSGVALAMLGLAACGSPKSTNTYGADPDLVAPHPESIPTIKTARAVGWPGGAAPVAPKGFVVTRFAEGLDHPRWLYVLPNGDVLVAQAATEAASGGVVAAVTNAVQQSAGAQGAGGNNILILRDVNQDGIAENRGVFLAGLNQPFGMGLLVNSFYVATTDALLRFPYNEGAAAITSPGEKVADLPNRPGRNGHWTRNLLVKNDGTKIYVSVGSATNVANDGVEVEQGRAAIYEIAPNGSGMRIFASGLRNPVGMAWEPKTGALWTSVNERDQLGDDLVPDYMTSVKDGGFYGWPYSYYGNHIDPRAPKNPDAVAKAIKPDYALGAHTASLGLTFYANVSFPPHYHGGAFIGQHGSWNRKEPAGYKVLFVPFVGGKPSGPPEEFLTGFLNAKGEAQGRPVGIAVDRLGALYVADDVGNIVWRIAPQR